MNTLLDCDGSPLIIAIHGLETGSPRTWEYDKTGNGTEVVNWLSDRNMLPAAVPRAAVYTYDWDARSFGNAPVQTLLGHADNLLASVAGERDSQGQHGGGRPIIFIASCFGGLILAEAIFRAEQEGSKYRDVLLATAGTVFLATPFRGTDAAVQAQWLVTIKGIMGEQSSDQLIRDLEARHDFVQQRVQRFAEIARAESIQLPVCCFYETQKTKLLRKVLPGLIADAQKSHFIVPFGRNANFVGRESIVNQLLERIPPSAYKHDCQRTAIEGLGGIGKTQIALEAAYRVHDMYPDCSVFWVPAIDLTTFENAYRRIGHKLKVPGIDDDKADPKVLVSEALSESKSQWLLIVDNADDSELLFGDTAISNNLPSGGKGSVLFTTRNHEAVVDLDITGHSIICLTGMIRSESSELLSKLLGDPQTDDTMRLSMNTLLDILADLPLAIKQAAAYMLSKKVTIPKYLEYCQTSDSALIKLLSRDFEDRGRYKTVKNPIVTTWLISFQQIERDSPLAAQYLKFISFLAEKDIPISILPQGDDELVAREAIGTLKAYGFIAERGTADSFDIHRLVRLATQNWIEQAEERSELITNAIRQLVVVAFESALERRKSMMEYLPHLESALGYKEASRDKEATMILMTCMALGYKKRGRYHEAEELCRQALDIGEGFLGQEHQVTSIAQASLARALGLQGRGEEAIQILQQVLEVLESTLGQEHPRTLDAMGELAKELGQQGRYREAERMLQQVRDIEEQVLDVGDSTVIRRANDYAVILMGQGQNESAMQIVQQALRQDQNLHEPEDYHTRTDLMTTLGRLLGKQGEHREAELVSRQVVDLEVKLHGREHLRTVAAMLSLADPILQQGNFQEVENILRQALALCEE
ncbi:hypothetical protein SLS53_000337, partial [Cytospora paraplurivora]